LPRDDDRSHRGGRRSGSAFLFALLVCLAAGAGSGSAAMPPSGKKHQASRQKAAEDKKNPFDLKVNRRKHNVVDPRRKKNEFNVVNARDRADELRRQTLMVEYSQQHKANNFVDRRFGEDDASLPEEDAMLMRYQKEKSRQLRKSRRDYSVEDGEELTHMGSALAEDRAGFAPSDEDGSDSEGERLETQLDKQNFGGFEKSEQPADGEERVKTKKEVMEEIIAKSKKHKAELRRTKEEKEDLVDELDEEFDEIAGLLQDRLAPVDPDEPKKEKTDQEREWDADAKEYNITKNLLVNELRSKPTDRLKSEEELAREEKERLDKLEAARLRRMNGEEAEDDDDDAGSSTVGGSGASARVLHRTGDELDDEDEFVSDNEEDATVTFRDGKMVVGDGGDGSEDEDEDAGEKDSDSEQDSDDDTYDNEGRPERGGMQPSFISGTEISQRPDPTGSLLDELSSNRSSRAVRVPVAESERAKRQRGVGEKDAAAEARAQAKLSMSSGSAQDIEEAAAALPFVFNCPSSVEAWAELAAGKPPALQSIILDRIRACHHISLAAENRSKLQKLYALLWKLVQETASAPAVPGAMSAVERLETISMLSKHVLAMTGAMPEFAGAVAIKYLRAIQSGHTQACDVEGGGAFGWPPAGAMMVLHLCSVVFPTSDLVHPVTTPAILVGGAILAQSVVATSADVLRGLFLCAWSVRIHREPRRLPSETLAWLVRMLEYAIPIDPIVEGGAEAADDMKDDGEQEVPVGKKGKGKGKKRKGEAKAKGGKRARVKEAADDDASETRSAFATAVTSALSELRGLGCTGTRLENEGRLRELLELGTPPVSKKKGGKKKKKGKEDDAGGELPVGEAGEITAVPLTAMLEACAAEAAAAEEEEPIAALPSYVLRAQCIGCAVRLVRQLVRMFQGCDSAAEVLGPLHACMSARSGSIAALPPAVGTLAAELAEAAEAAVTSCAQGRRPLEYLRRAPVAIRALNPKWEDKKERGFAGLTTVSKKEEKEQLKKLQRQHKKEMRSAAKDLRKDGAMLGRQRLEEWKTMRKRDEGKKNEIMNILQTQQSEFGKGTKKFHKK
jgi:nucleolar protein 14